LIDFRRTIADARTAWENAHAILCKDVNKVLREVGANVRLPVRRAPAKLDFKTAIFHLEAAIHRLKNFAVIPSDQPWLVLGNNPYPMDDAAGPEWYLQRLARVNVDDQFWRREIVEPMQRHAEAVRKWLARMSKEAGHDSVAGVHTPPPLTRLEKAVLNIIKVQPKDKGITGNKIIAELARQRITTEQSTLTRHIIPKLKRWYGVKNRPGVGYYISSK